MRRSNAAALSVCFALLVLGTAGVGRETAANLPATEAREKALPLLSDYGFFEGALTDFAPADNVYPYALNTPLFSDYAHKARFIYLPEDSTMTWDDVEVFDMPVGAAIVKHFYYLNDERDTSLGKRMIETRILKHTEKGWKAWGYAWNDEQTDAEYKPLGVKTGVDWKDADGKPRHVDYESPNQFQCKSCHSYNGDMRPIGPAARQLHGGETDYAAHWADAGLLTGAPADRNTWPSMNWRAEGISTEAAARAYLDANCGYCHRHEGPASTSGLFLHDRYATGPETGVRKSPVAAGKGSGGRKYDIYPGKPDKSILYYRMASNDAAVRMPEVGRSVAHEEGLAVVRAWIEGLN